MTRLGSLISAPCGGTSAGIQDVIPRDNTIPGWTVDTASTNKSGSARWPVLRQPTKPTATVDCGMDGAAVPFYENPAIGAPTFGRAGLREFHAQCASRVYHELYVMQMPSATAASGLYAYLPSPDSKLRRSTRSPGRSRPAPWWVHNLESSIPVRRGGSISTRARTTSKFFLSSDDSSTWEARHGCQGGGIDFATKLASKM
jgi:hypothetical protein